jgi:hypothetical protein
MDPVISPLHGSRARIMYLAVPAWPRVSLDWRGSRMYLRNVRDHGAFQLRSDPAVVMLEVRRFFGSV